MYFWRACVKLLDVRDIYESSDEFYLPLLSTMNFLIPRFTALTVCRAHSSREFARWWYKNILQKGWGGKKRHSFQCPDLKHISVSWNIKSGPGRVSRYIYIYTNEIMKNVSILFPLMQPQCISFHASKNSYLTIIREFNFLLIYLTR